MIRKALKIVVFAILILALVMVVKTFTTGSKQVPIAYAGKAPRDTAALQRLSEVIRFRTISYDDSLESKNKLHELKKMYRWMETKYPKVHAHAKVIRFEKGSSILIFEGSEKQLKPAIFLAHLDVVPADSSKGTDWKFPPFSGTIAGDTLYGRGCLDDKSIAIAMLEGMEKIIASGKKNTRTIIFAFGHDEETGGENGASVLADYFVKNNITAEFICDEGFGVMEGLVPGTDKPVAIIGVAEKGFLSVKLSVKIEGGHSSIPKPDNATSVLTIALAKVEQHQPHAYFCEPQKAFFNYLAPEASFAYRFLFSNLWITAPVVKSVLSKNEKTAATIKTTHATTIIKAGDKSNVLPGYAEAVVNFRILPGENIASVFDELKRTVDDQRVQLEMLPDRNEPSAVSATSGLGWDCIRSSIHSNFENIISVPSLVLAGTDCKHYYKISNNIYRFTPLRLNNENLGGIHGYNERIAAQNYYEVLRYYHILFSKL